MEHLAAAGVRVPKGVPMRKIFLAIILSGAASFTAFSSSAGQAQPSPNAGAHQQVVRSAPGGRGQHVPHGQSPQHSRPIMPGGASQHTNPGGPPAAAGPTGTGGAWQHSPFTRSSHAPRSGAPDRTWQHVTPGNMSTERPGTHTQRMPPNAGSSHVGESVGQQHGRTEMPRIVHAPTSQSFDRASEYQHRRPPVSSTPRFGTEPPLRHDRHTTRPTHWNGNWRHDTRYNWHDYRQHHRSIYHLGYYHDPFGWAYQTFAIGWRLWPSYYESSYWIEDPWTYRLPPAPPGTRWIRYYNDALLVDIYTGEVLDVIHDFFW